MKSLSLDTVSSALALSDFDHLTAWERMAPRARNFDRPLDKSGSVREASVLLLLYPAEDQLTFVLTKRTDTVSTHKGQVSLPGGSREPEDSTLDETALRETCEEVGFCRTSDIQLLGRLTPIYVNVSDYEIHPYVGFIDYVPEFSVQVEEVAEVIQMPLASLFDDDIKEMERWQRGKYDMDVPFYRFNGHVIWGATAIILSEFEWRLRAVAG